MAATCRLAKEINRRDVINTCLPAGVSQRISRSSVPDLMLRRRYEIERAKCFASLRRALLKVLVEHLFPTGRVEAGGVRYHTVEVEKDRVVLVAGDHPPAVGLPHRTLSCYQGHAFPLIIA